MPKAKLGFNFKVSSKVGHAYIIFYYRGYLEGICRPAMPHCAIFRYFCFAVKLTYTPSPTMVTELMWFLSVALAVLCLASAACLPGLCVWIFGLNAGSIRKLWTAVPTAMTRLNLKVDFASANVPSLASLKGGKGWWRCSISMEIINGLSIQLPT